MEMLTEEQKAAINAIIKWSTIPTATMEWACISIESKPIPDNTYIQKDLRALGRAVSNLCDVFGWKEIP